MNEKSMKLIRLDKNFIWGNGGLIWHLLSCKGLNWEIINIKKDIIGRIAWNLWIKEESTILKEDYNNNKIVMGWSIIGSSTGILLLIISKIVCISKWGNKLPHPCRIITKKK